MLSALSLGPQLASWPPAFLLHNGQNSFLHKLVYDSEKEGVQVCLLDSSAKSETTIPHLQQVPWHLVCKIPTIRTLLYLLLNRNILDSLHVHHLFCFNPFTSCVHSIARPKCPIDNDFVAVWACSQEAAGMNRKRTLERRTFEKQRTPHRLHWLHNVCPTPGSNCRQSDSPSGHP